MSKSQASAPRGNGNHSSRREILPVLLFVLFVFSMDWKRHTHMGKDESFIKSPASPADLFQKHSPRHTPTNTDLPAFMAQLSSVTLTPNCDWSLSLVNSSWSRGFLSKIHLSLISQSPMLFSSLWWWRWSQQLQWTQYCFCFTVLVDVEESCKNLRSNTGMLTVVKFAHFNYTFKSQPKWHKMSLQTNSSTFSQTWIKFQLW